MPHSLSRQILEGHLVEGELKPGEPIALKIDQTLLQDATGTMAFMQFEQLGVPRVQVERAVQYIDHNVVQLDYKNPDDHRMLQALCAKHGAFFSRPGNGISHYISLERFAKPGDIMVGADSHTPTSGALGMVAIGAGGLDVAVAMGGYPYEIACPPIVEVWLEGTLARPWVAGRPRPSRSRVPGPLTSRAPSRARPRTRPPSSARQRRSYHAKKSVAT